MGIYLLLSFVRLCCIACICLLFIMRSCELRDANFGSEVGTLKKGVRHPARLNTASGAFAGRRAECHDYFTSEPQQRARLSSSRGRPLLSLQRGGCLALAPCWARRRAPHLLSWLAELEGGVHDAGSSSGMPGKDIVSTRLTIEAGNSAIFRWAGKRWTKRHRRRFALPETLKCIISGISPRTYGPLMFIWSMVIEVGAD